jgi:hypothetical protein
MSKGLHIEQPNIGLVAFYPKRAAFSQTITRSLGCQAETYRAENVMAQEIVGQHQDMLASGHLH